MTALARSLHPELDLLETTLRDGSYVVDFRFTAADTAWLASQLEQAGVNWIEIGHGLGLGASRVYREAAASDQAYVAAARHALKRAKFGMFCIPGIATLDDLRQARDGGMDFVRIGANLDRTREMEPFIRLARSLGLHVCTNFMKSYTLPPERFAEVARMTEEWGSQMNYLVDSAGGMVPEDVRLYCEELARRTSIPFGFHGHDNVRLATANSLVAVECGALWVDVTLFGVGRGSGNAATELMTGLLQNRYDRLRHFDLNRLMRLAETQAVPLTYYRHQETLSMSLGLAQVHSSFLDRIVERAKEAKVDPYELIAAVGAIDRVDATDLVIGQAIENVRRHQRPTPRQEGGLFELEHDGTAASAVRTAESVADKLGLPCQVWIGAEHPAETVDIVRSAQAIEVRVCGDALKAVNAVTRPSTRIVLAPNLSALRARLSGRGDLSITVADVRPGWAGR
ncbi:MAG: 4-hydroxy-2-oxovalerate aldolase [Alphaproteobacteria bacterium]|nr:4-hydroxy-2-oxovalerate aldolase [Alphaproteobacteria bacterium]